MLVTRTNFKGRTHTLEIPITPEQLALVDNRKQNGMLIQRIVPELSAADREFLISGLTKAEWDEIFPPED